jgi:(1->4)-alpha-D-glucan 1-alpha-D-glucosylmutase
MTEPSSRHDSLASRVDGIAREAAGRLSIPRATYRLQFHAGFTFRDALNILDYLDDLGISHVYASPLFAAREGSTHGYDIVDPTRLNPVLGTEEDFAALRSGLQARGMGLILDIVPNHMGINDPGNTWWLDVLENGRSSQYAPYFDVQWQPVKPELAERVLLPVLGDQYGTALEAGHLRLVYGDGAFQFDYFGSRYPVAPGTYTSILAQCSTRLQARQEPGENATPPDSSGPAPAEGPGSEELIELESIRTAIGYLPSRKETDPVRLAERQREKEVIKRRLARLYEESEPFREVLDETVEALNGRPGDPASFDALDQLLEQQAHRLAFWRVAGEEINYRRFFDINDLAAIRVEDPRVFDAVHALALRMLLEGKADGLRIDHPDGLYDPPGYFRRIQQQYLLALATRELGEEVEREALEQEVSAWVSARASERRRQRTSLAGLRRCRENPERGRTVTLRLGRVRHHRLRLPGFGQQPVRCPYECTGI